MVTNPECWGSGYDAPYNGLYSAIPVLVNGAANYVDVATGGTHIFLKSKLTEKLGVFAVQSIVNPTITNMPLSGATSFSAGHYYLYALNSAGQFLGLGLNVDYGIKGMGTLISAPQFIRRAE